MSRAAAIARAHSYFDSGEFLVDLPAPRRHP